MGKDDLLTAEDVARLLGIKRDWVGTMVARNEIPYVLIGPRRKAESYRFRRSEIEAWMAQNDAENREEAAP